LLSELDVENELLEVQRKSDLFEETFKRNLTFGIHRLHK
jgi:hypothetical protein